MDCRLLAASWKLIADAHNYTTVHDRKAQTLQERFKKLRGIKMPSDKGDGQRVRQKDE